MRHLACLTRFRAFHFYFPLILLHITHFSEYAEAEAKSETDDDESDTDDDDDEKDEL